MEGLGATRRRLGGLAASSLALLLCFGWPLFRLMRFAASSELYSYIILIPIISLYLVWIQKERVPNDSAPDKKLFILFTIAGLAVLASYGAVARFGIGLAKDDALALTTLSFVLLLWGICCWFLGRQAVRSIAFPLGFLILMVPFPIFLRSWIEAALQQWSAIAALGMFRLTGTPVFYHDLIFQLSDITLRVAPECSGIHSSVALLITSILAGHLFLRSRWRRSALAAAVLPLAILRNGFRIFTIGELCVHVGPQMIDSSIHHKGGPIFFALSLVPFLVFLFFLIKSERPRGAPKLVTHEA
jgi:exosortase C (VPDSG-CTERM-specific)